MTVSTRRGVHWWIPRLQFYGFMFVGWFFGVVMTFVLLHVVAMVVSSLNLAPAGSFAAMIIDFWNLGLAPGSNATQTWFQLAVSLGVYGLWFGIRFAYYSRRYRFGHDLARVRTLLIFDPQMALVRQRLTLEKAMVDMTAPMQSEYDYSLHDAIRALTILKKMPHEYAKIAHDLRVSGNMAVHSRNDAQQKQMEPVNALSLALENNSKLKRLLVWYRRNAKRQRMTAEEWEQIRHQFVMSRAGDAQNNSGSRASEQNAGPHRSGERRQGRFVRALRFASGERRDSDGQPGSSHRPADGRRPISDDGPAHDERAGEVVRAARGEVHGERAGAGDPADHAERPGSGSRRIPGEHRTKLGNRHSRGSTVVQGTRRSGGWVFLLALLAALAAGYWLLG